MNWSDNYEIISKNIGGGQGDCFIVRDKRTGVNGFLKKLKDNKSERRARFFRETTLFQSLDVQGIPKILETNVGAFHTRDELYYVCEFINGKRLDDWVKANDYDESEIANLFEQLLNILQKCHDQEIVHRDIKPENILIRESSVFLVDFGISVINSSQENITQIGQELGNRFLRLPEFSAGSANKRDARSDLTLASGIAIYLFTKTYPRNLINERGQYPHQRSESNELSKTKYSFIWNIIFDRSFQQDISRRWTNANEIIGLLHKMNNEETDDLDKYKELLRTHSELLPRNELVQLKSDLVNLNNTILRNVELILDKNASGFRRDKMGWVYNLGDALNKNQITVFPIGKEMNVAIKIVTRSTGEQIIGEIYINDKENIEVCRIKPGTTLNSIEEKNMNSTLEKNILRSLVNILNGV